MLSFLWPLFLLTMFWQTRVALCCQGQVVDYLIPFVYLSDVFVLAILVVTAWNYIRTSRPWGSYVKNRALLALVTTFFVLAAATNLNAAHPLGAWYKWLKLAEMALFSLLIGTLSSRDLKVWRWISSGLVPIAVIAWGEVFLQHSLGLQFLGEWQFSVAQPGIAKVMLAGRQLMRPYATFPHPNVLGGVFALFAVVNLWDVLEKKELRVTDYRLRITKVLLFSSVVLISFSRSAWLAYAAMLTATLWAKRDRLRLLFKNRRYLRYPIAAAVVTATLLVAPRLSTLTTTDVLSYERRVQLNRAAVAMIKEKPLIGVGLNNFVPNLEKFSVITGQGRFLQPVHNVPLLIAAEVGLPDFLILASCLLILFFKLWRRRAYLLLTIWLGIAVTAMFDHYWYTLQHGLLMVALTSGLSLSKISSNEE